MKNRLNIKKQKLATIAAVTKKQKFISNTQITSVLEQVIHPYDRLVIEGDNQKQASFLVNALNQVSNKIVNHLSLVIPSVELKAELDLFENGIASSLDFAFAGPQSAHLAELINQKQLTVNNIHTYLELYGRLFVDLIPDVALIIGMQADLQGNLYLAENTEETPILVEATATKFGIVIAQVNEIVDQLPRIDIPADQVDLIVTSDHPEQPYPLFTKDPQNITHEQILAAMLAIKGIYGKYKVKTLNHGIGYNTAAIELILPTYGSQLGLKHQIATNWVNNPTPTLIPAIEAGWIESIYCFGGEAGMEKYIAAHPEIFAVDHHFNLKSNRVFAQIAGQYAIDMFVGSTLQIDHLGNASTITANRLSGFGGAPNMGSNPHGRRHLTPPYQKFGNRKLVVQLANSRRWNHEPVFVENLDAMKIKNNVNVDPIMIYSHDTTHIVTENGIANLYKTTSPTEKKMAIEAIAGNTSIGNLCSSAKRRNLQAQGLITTLEDLNIHSEQATSNLLAARSINDLIKCSKGLYQPKH